MRFLKSILLITTLFFGLLTPSTTNALSLYQLTLQNFNQVTSEIEQQYGDLINAGPGFDALLHFLMTELTTYNTRYACEPPAPRASLTPQKELFFSWASESKADSYNSAYFSFYTGVNEKFKTVEPNVTMALDPYSYHLFSFYSECKGAQGAVNLIIVDRDVFTLTGSGNDVYFSFPDRLRHPAPFSISPNPATQHVGLDFQLEKPQDVKVELRDITGRLVQPTLYLGRLREGTYQEQISLNGLPKGIYICTLTADRPYTQRLIKRD